MMVLGNSHLWVSRVAELGLSIMAVATPIAGVADSGPQDALMHGDLDGKMFVGTFAPADGSSGRQDALSFRGGQFWSGVCVPCGFAPTAYWVRKVGDKIHFRGAMVAYFSPSWTAFQADRGRCFSGIVDGVSG